jgi:hypothetical protein
VHARLYKNIPVENITMIVQPLDALDSAIKARNSARFTKSFSDLTVTCNVCHEAAHVDFIRMQIPTTSPFSDQIFAPKGK